MIMFDKNKRTPCVHWQSYVEQANDGNDVWYMVKCGRYSNVVFANECNKDCNLFESYKQANNKRLKELNRTERWLKKLEAERSGKVNIHEQRSNSNE